ncbi:hypothetical protein IHE45_08G058400 [Dioscorea alata]|uniref:Uncharacterized protein n=1 Tax=Dioscorea alata TaxID=55571 RepID=A0ACB7VJN8_DIOAL|nr:hypothetical protein IHE45_08G058400 [Dioscorea alata]
MRSIPPSSKRRSISGFFEKGEEESDVFFMPFLVHLLGFRHEMIYVIVVVLYWYCTGSVRYAGPQRLSAHLIVTRNSIKMVDNRINALRQCLCGHGKKEQAWKRMMEVNLFCRSIMKKKLNFCRTRMTSLVVKRKRTKKIKLAGCSKVKNKEDINLDADHTQREVLGQYWVSPSCERRNLVRTGHLTGHSSYSQNVTRRNFFDILLSYVC